MSLKPLKKSRLSAWVERLSNEELPVFAHTARCMASISGDDESSASDLAEAILHDSAMTARVLKTANSVFYKPSGKGIDTVSYAIVLLGFESIRNLALSISLIDTVLGGVRHDHALQELIRCFHAAIQAKSLAQQLKLPNEEDIYIAAVLHRLGQIAFWCFPYEKAEALDSLYQKGIEAESAEKETLGFSLLNLTQALSSEWHLSQILNLALNEKNNNELGALCVKLGFQIADEVDNDWSSDKMHRHISQVAELLGERIADAQQLVFKNARSAADLLNEFGINSFSHILPPESTASASCAASDFEEEDRHHVYDQLTVIREITSMLNSQIDLNTLLSTVTVAIFRSLQMDNVVLALINPTKGKLQAKQVLGKDRRQLEKNFSFSALEKDKNLFSLTLTQGQALWFDKDTRRKYSSYESSELINCIGKEDFFCMPISFPGKIIGLIYASRNQNSKPLNRHEFLTFRHYCELICIGLSLQKNLS